MALYRASIADAGRGEGFIGVRRWRIAGKTGVYILTEGPEGFGALLDTLYDGVNVSDMGGTEEKKFTYVRQSFPSIGF
jgi:hypothetical protein